MTFLRRETVNLDTPELRKFIEGKKVVVTGGGGSIGSEICRQVFKYGAAKIMPLGRTENALFEIDRELKARGSNRAVDVTTRNSPPGFKEWKACSPEVQPIIADICDEARIRQIMRMEKPDIVFHCAAHKHVPLMEQHPCEAIKNNVFGTKTVADAAEICEVDAFVMVSTDKAVNPSSVMGASKRCAELYIQNLGRRKMKSRFMTVRFGNVLGSSGSVVPIFQRQIDNGGPVMVTHPDMERYFMTIPEASQLVMQAGAIGEGGEIFLLDMGAPVKIVDLARDMIAQSGKDIEIKFSGIRPGEKLYEELTYTTDQTIPTSHPKIMVWKTGAPSNDAIESMLMTLNIAAEIGQKEGSVAALRTCVPEYRTAI